MYGVPFALGFFFCAMGYIDHHGAPSAWKPWACMPRCRLTPLHLRAGVGSSGKARAGMVMLNLTTFGMRGNTSNTIALLLVRRVPNNSTVIHSPNYQTSSAKVLQIVGNYL